MPRVGTTLSIDESPYDEPRRLELLPALPDSASRKRLREKLLANGLSRLAADAVVRAVVSPDQAVALLDNPTTYRVPGAQLLAIRVDCFTTRVIPDATNPRVLEALPFPASMRPGSSEQAQFAPIDPPTAGEHEFEVTVASLDQLVWQLTATINATIKENEPRPPISEQGIMEPPLAVPAVVRDQSGGDIHGVVLVREGSTRISHAHRLLGLSARDVLVNYAEDRHQRSLITSLNNIAQSPKSSILPEDAAKIRVAVTPVDLVIGVRADSPTSAVGLGEAVDAKVAQDHLNHKKQWRESYRDAFLGATCLRALSDELLVSDERYRWLAGQLAPDSTVDGEDVYEDDRWTDLLWHFTTNDRRVSQAVKRPIATVLERDEGRRSVQRKDRVPLAVSLAMRARRGQVTPVAAERDTKLLEGSVPSVVWSTGWTPGDKSLEELTQQALRDAETRTPSAAGAELAVRAIWYLTKDGLLSMPRNDQGPGADRRNPGEVVGEMLTSARGVHQLARAIQDGRLGDPVALITNDDAEVEVSGVGKPVPLGEQTIRRDLAPREGPPPPPIRDTKDEFLDAVAGLNRHGRALRLADARLREISGPSELYFEAEGVDPSQIEDLKATLHEVIDHLGTYEQNWRVADMVRKRSAGAQK